MEKTGKRFRFTVIITLCLAAVALFAATGCNKMETLSTPQNNDDIIGKWKLMEVSIIINYQKPEIIDYSENNIIYDFQKNNKLIITGSIPDNLFIFDDFQKGEHFYTYHKLDVPTYMPAQNLHIDNPKIGNEEGHYYCKVLDNGETMEISAGKVIGGIIDEAGLVSGGDFYQVSKFFIKLN